MDNLTIFGDRVLILLDIERENTKTDSGIEVPHYVQDETDGGRPTVKLSGRKYLPQGTVVNVSPLASAKLKEHQTPLTVNDRVLVSYAALNPSYQFFPERTKHVIAHHGYMLIPYSLIEAKINQ